MIKPQIAYYVSETVVKKIFLSSGRAVLYLFSFKKYGWERHFLPFQLQTPGIWLIYIEKKHNRPY